MSNHIASVTKALLDSGARRAIKYVSHTHIICATMCRWQGKLPTKSQPNRIVVIIGKPNSLERAFIRKCKKAGETFPVRKIQLHFAKRK